MLLGSPKGCNSERIFSKEFHKLTEGYQAAELRVTCNDLFDEFDTDYQGILTYEMEGAPRVQYFGHKRYVEARETILGEEDHIHKDQLKLMFPEAQEKGNMKIKGGKAGTSALVYSVQDILNKRDFKKTGRQVSTSKPSAPAFVRTSSGERTIAPPVPQFREAQTELLPQPSSPRAESSMVGASSKVSDPSLGLPGSPQPSLIGALNPSNLQEHLKHHGDDTQKASPGYCGASPQASSPPQSPEASREDAASHVGSTLEELSPAHLGPEAKWDWKARQLQYEAALLGPKRWGRERKTCETYATDAELAGKHGVACALRVRSEFHLKCENLRFGGWKSKAFATLKKDADDIEPKLEDGWPLVSEKEIVKRWTTEIAKNPQMVVAQWSSFIDLTAGWPLPCDTNEILKRLTVKHVRMRAMRATPIVKAEFSLRFSRTTF